MNFKNATEHKMAATFALHSLKALFNEKDGMERLKKVFLSSLLTPKDIVAQARKMQLRSGNVSTAIYEDIQYALYIFVHMSATERLVFHGLYSEKKSPPMLLKT